MATISRVMGSWYNITIYNRGDVGGRKYVFGPTKADFSPSCYYDNFRGHSEKESKTVSDIFARCWRRVDLWL